MAAIDETISGNTASSSTTPTSTITDVVIERTGGGGKVLLQVQAPSSSNWITLHDEGGSFTVATPDTNLTYRFLPVNVTGSAHVYFGA